VDAVTGRARSGAVALSQRPANGDDQSGLDRPTVECLRADHRADRAGAIVDGDPEPITELVRRRGHGPADLDAATLVGLTGCAGVDRLDGRQGGICSPHQVCLGDAQRSLSEPAGDLAGDRDGRPGRPHPDDRRVEIEGDAAARVLDEAASAVLERAE